MWRQFSSRSAGNVAQKGNHVDLGILFGGKLYSHTLTHPQTRRSGNLGITAILLMELQRVAHQGSLTGC